MADIFISYKREDRSRVEPLAKALEDQGWSVFWDRTIPAGKTWRQVIGDALKTARSVIVAWSKTSVDSSWVQEEADRGRERNILIPVLIDNVRPPLGFGAIQAADLISWEPTQSSPEFEKLISDLSAILGSSPLQVRETEQKRAEEEQRRRQEEAEAKRKAEEDERLKEQEEQKRKAAEEKRLKEQELKQKAEEERQKKETEAKRKTNEDRKRSEVNAEREPEMPQPATVKSPETKPDAAKSPEPKSYEPHKTINALKFGAVGVVIVLLIVGIWWWISRQQVNEVRQEIEKLNKQTLNLENAVAKIDNQEQLKELYMQRDALNHQVAAFGEKAIKVGLESQLKELQNRLNQVQIQLANKEKQINFEIEKPPPPQKTIAKSVDMNFVLIPAGKFVMGSPSDEPDREDGEKQHEVIISKPFSLQTTEVSQGQWKEVMGDIMDNPSRFKDCGDDCPVEQVSWDDAQKFIEKLNKREGTNIYRLPTEAEWEYACRAETTTPFFTGQCISTDQANYDGNHPGKNCPKGEYRGKTVKVGSFQPNAWGLYDMHGNAWEWVQDWHGDYPSNSIVDPKRRHKGEGRVLRGGSWSQLAGHLRSAYRRRSNHDSRFSGYGFRVARDF